MTSLAGRALSVYREDGALVLGKKSLRKLHTKLYCQVMALRGHYSLTLDSRTVKFSAPTPTMVNRNQMRFQSEREELRAFLDTIKLEDRVYDVSANTGLYSLFAATKCQNGTVAAFEPYPSNVEILQRDLTRNDFHNIDIVESALSDTVGNIEFSQPEKDDIGYGSSSINTEAEGDAVTVPTTTGEKLVADGKPPQPNVVKIDVEGAGLLMITGMKETPSVPKCRAVFCEIHLPGVHRRPSVEDFGSSPKESVSKLESFGFTIKKIGTTRDSEIMIKVMK